MGSVGLNSDFVTTFAERKDSAVAGIDRLLAMVESGEVDLVAVGRALLADPVWAAKIRDERTEELEPFRVELLQVLT